MAWNTLNGPTVRDADYPSSRGLLANSSGWGPLRRLPQVLVYVPWALVNGWFNSPLSWCNHMQSDQGEDRHTLAWMSVCFCLLHNSLWNCQAKGTNRSGTRLDTMPLFPRERALWVGLQALAYLVSQGPCLMPDQVSFVHLCIRPTEQIASHSRAGYFSQRIRGRFTVLVDISETQMKKVYTIK